MSATTPRAGKPERRRKRPVDLAEIDDIPAPSQQSQHGGAGSGREAARRTSPRMPKAQGASAHEKSHAAGMLDKGIGKRMAKRAKQRASGTSEGELEERPLLSKQPMRQGAKKRALASNGGGKRAKISGAAAEAAPTQKQILRDRPRRTRKVRDEGVDAAQ
jgi:hypothetical protein